MKADAVGEPQFVFSELLSAVKMTDFMIQKNPAA
jgi:hypothetical protein